MPADHRELARANLERLGIRPGDEDLERLAPFVQRRSYVPAPHLVTEPWTLPRTVRWNRG